MTVITRRPENRLSKTIWAPGGKTMEKALEDANASLDEVREERLDALRAKLTEIQALGRRCEKNAKLGDIRALYALASDVNDIAGVFGRRPELGQAAYSLRARAPRQSRGAQGVELGGGAGASEQAAAAGRSGQRPPRSAQGGGRGPAPGLPAGLQPLEADRLHHALTLNRDPPSRLFKDRAMDLGERAPAWTEAKPDVLDDFARRGFHLFDQPVDPAAAAGLLAQLRADRRYDDSLFLSEADFDADPQYRGVNPRPGRNLLERSRVISSASSNRLPHIVNGLTRLLGPGYRIMDRKVVCGVPAKAIPSWLKARIAGNPVNNLGAFVKPQEPRRDLFLWHRLPTRI